MTHQCQRTSTILLTALTAIVLGGIPRRALASPLSAAGGSLPGPELPHPPRLTLRLVGEPVVDLLGRVSAKAPFNLLAADPIGERRVDVVVHGLTQRRFRTALAEVVDGVWLPVHHPPSLSLEPNPAGPRELAALLTQRKQRFFGGLRSLVRNLSLDPAGVDRLRAVDPYSAVYLTAPGSRAGIQLLSVLSEGQWRQLESTGHLSVTAAQLGPQGPSMLRQYARYMLDMAKKLPRRPAQPPAPPGDVDEMSQGTLDFVVDDTAMSGDQPYSYLGVRLSGRGYSSDFMLSGSQATNAPSPRWSGAIGPVDHLGPIGKRVSVAFDRPPADWGDALSAVAGALHLQAVAEDYTHLRARPLPLDKDNQISGTLPEILDRLCTAYGYQWRWEEGVYEFRSATWYVDRDQEPPGTLIKAAEVAAGEHKPLSLDWLARAATLPVSEPSERLWAHVPSARPVVTNFRAFLRLYASLTPRQRDALAMGGGLPGDALSPAQHSLAWETLVRLAADRTPDAVGHLRLHLVPQAASARLVIALGDRKTGAVISFPWPPARGAAPR